MEQCECCKKDFKIKDLFLQWCTSGETYICENCIKRNKQYTIDTCYSADSDITFIFAMARVQITKHEFIELSQTLIGYCYGSPDSNDGYISAILKDWLTKDDKIRKDLLRQSFNENQKDKEVLY